MYIYSIYYMFNSFHAWEIIFILPFSVRSTVSLAKIINNNNPISCTGTKISEESQSYIYLSFGVFPFTLGFTLASETFDVNWWFFRFTFWSCRWWMHVWTTDNWKEGGLYAVGLKFCVWQGLGFWLHIAWQTLLLRNGKS